MKGAQIPPGKSAFLGRYQLVEKIATGGMAEVFKAKYETFGGIEKVVIVKRILPQFTGDEEFTRMFSDEARVSMALSHVNLVQTFDFGQVDGEYFIVMEYIEGADLLSVLRECHFKRIPIPMELSVFVVAEVLRGLDYAHRRIDPATGKPMNIVHRDISPANVMISHIGNVKLMDFGIAKSKSKQSRTQIGTLKGKYSYMSPQQARGEEVDFRSDIFSCGIILYELVTGVRPFRGKNDLEILEKVKAAQHEPPRKVNPHVPRALEEVIETALAREPERRFQETGQFCDRLGAVLVSMRESESDIRPDSTALARFMQSVFPREPETTSTATGSPLPAGSLAQRALQAKSGPPETPPRARGGAARPPAASDLDSTESAGEAEAALDLAVAAFRFAAPGGREGEQALRQFLAQVEDECVNRGGRVEQRTDASLIAYFDADGAEVDHRIRAVETARRVVDLARDGEGDLRVTSGVCAGTVSRGVTQASVKTLAQVMRLAERLAQRAEGVGVLVDEATSKSIVDGYVLRRVADADGSVAFAPIRSAKPLDRPSAKHRALIGTVGRDAEMRRLSGALEAVAGGAGARAVALTGTAGIGKSHLVHEILRQAAGRKASVVIGRCVAAGRQVAFSVFQDLLRDLLGLPDGAGREAISTRLERQIAELNLAPSLPATLKPLYGGARAISADQLTAIARGLHELLSAMATGGRLLVLVIEDVHWADEPTRRVVGEVIDRLKQERLLVMVTARSDVGDGWLKARRGMEEIPLGPLDDASVLKIAMERMQLATLSKELADHLRLRARGNPLYLLETVRTLTEKGIGGAPGVSTHRQNLVGSQMYSPVIRKPQVLSERQQERLDRARAAVAPQIRGFADDFRRLSAWIRPIVTGMLDGIVRLFRFARKVKRDYDPKTADSLTRDE